MVGKPKFEKVDNHTIKIVETTTNEVPLNVVIQRKNQLVSQKKQLEQQTKTQLDKIKRAIENIDTILTEAKKMGVTPVEEKQNGSGNNKNQ